MIEKIRLGKYVRAILITGDFAMINLAYILVRLFMHPSPEFESKYVWLLVNIAFIPSALIYSDVHKLRILYADRLMMQALKSTVLYGAVIIALLYVFDQFDVGWASGIPFIAIYFTLICCWWLFSHRTIRRMRRMGFNFKRVIVIGANATTRMLVKELQSDSGYGYRLMGFFDDDEKALEDFSDHYTAPYSHVTDFVKANKIDLIFYTLDAADTERLGFAMRVADECGVEFVYVPYFNPMLRGHFSQSEVGSMPVMTHVMSPLSKDRNKLLKRTCDLAFSIPLMILSPLVLIPMAIGIKLSSPGPVFFRQKRTGIYGKDFWCYKFRTMRVNDQADTMQATQNDPRKTRFGDFLRRTSIDELPQFYNVLLGNMSVVGPRPHMVSQTEDYSRLIDKYMLRHAIKPGITGWAQVNGYRGGTKHLWQMEKRVEYDVWYIHHWNIFLDLKIVYLTVFNAFKGDSNAY